MSSVLTPRPRHPSRPRITTARSSPRVIRRERETETPLGRPVIIFSPSHPSSSSFPSSRLRVASRHPRSTTERHRTIDARDVVRVRASPFAREVPSRHPSIRVRRRGAHVPSFVSSALPSSSTARDATRRRKKNEKRIDAHLLSRSVARSARSNADSNRSPVVASTVRDRCVRSVHLHLLVYFIIVYDLWTRSIYETRLCGENPNARMRVIHACVHE